MAFRFIDARARLWQSRGLFFLLGEPKNALYTYGVEKTRVSPPRGQQAGRPPARPPVRPPQSRPAPAAPPEAARPKQQIQLVPFEQWPDAWKKVAAQLSPGSVVWSYPHLGYDLSNVETTDRVIRRQFFSQIFSDKPPYPPGTHTFWPYALPNANGELETNIPLFFAGLARLKAQVVILLGSEAGVSVVGTGTPYTHRLLPHGIASMVFQDIAKLREDGQLYNRMMGMVRSLLLRSDIYPLRRS